jgi:YD repeat-containing protein
MPVVSTIAMRFDMSNKQLRLLAAATLMTTSLAAHAQLPWSEQTHQIAFGDFNGDGKTDLLYLARDSAQTSGIALSNNAGPFTAVQAWPSNYLGIAWHSGNYNPIVADFNGDGKADILMQRQTAADHYLLFATSTGQITAISQTIGNTLGGQTWSADGHHLVPGDFNGDGKADLFLQSATAAGLNAVFLAGSSGTFASAQQTWGNTHLGFKWSLKNAVVLAADFNADEKADLFIQAKPQITIIDYDVPFPVPAYSPGSFGIANAKAANGNGELFYTPALQIWDRKFQGVDWSAAFYDAVVGDFNGDGRADIILQAKKAGATNSQFNVSASGQITSASVLTDPTVLNATGDQYRLFAANFDGTPGAGVYIQAVSSGGTSLIAWNSTATSSWSDSYEYDALGRLRKVTYQNGAITNYTLDPAGNRTNVTTTTP